MKINPLRLAQIYFKRILLSFTKDGKDSKYFNEEYCTTFACTLFDRKFYKEQYLKNCDKDIDLVEHYVNEGWKLGYSPSLKFNNDAYLYIHQDLIKSNVSPIYNFLKNKGKQSYFRINFDPVKDAATVYPKLPQSQLKSELKLGDKESSKVKNKNILIVSHELSNTGAPMVMVELVVALKELGYNVVVLCPEDGPIRDKLEKINALVIVDKYFFMKLMLQRPKLLDFINQFSIVWFNTLAYAHYAQYIPNELKTMCWIHEANRFLDDPPYDLEVLRKIDVLLSVSNYVLKSLQNHIDIKSEVLYYGLDFNKFKGEPSLKAIDNNKITFLSVGTYYFRKGMDILVSYIDSLPQELKTQCRFVIVGKNGNTVQFDKEQLDRNPEIEILGELSHEETLQQILNCDVLVCLSRDDPLPTVITEATIYGKAVMCSENVGQYSLIKDQDTGFKVSSKEDFISSVEYILNHKAELPKISEKFKDQYLPLVDYKNFKENVSKLLEKSYGIDKLLDTEKHLVNGRCVN